MKLTKDERQALKPLIRQICAMDCVRQMKVYCGGYVRVWVQTHKLYDLVHIANNIETFLRTMGYKDKGANVYQTGEELYIELAWRVEKRNSED